MRQILDSKLSISPEKFQCGPVVKILGSIWDQGKLRLDIIKIVSFRYVVLIRDQKDLLGNLEVFNFIKQFCPRVSEKLEYYYKKAHEANFSWTRADAVGLLNIWKQIEFDTVIWIPDNNRKLYLRVDAATKIGFSGTVFQLDDQGKERYILHVSRHLNDAMKWSVVKLEFYTIVYVFENYGHLFVGRRTTIFTDAKPIVELLKYVKI